LWVGFDYCWSPLNGEGGKPRDGEPWFADKSNKPRERVAVDRDKAVAKQQQEKD